MSKESMDGEHQKVVDDFQRLLGPDTAIPVAAIKTLIGVIQRSKNTTIRGMEEELKDAIKIMENTLGGYMIRDRGKTFAETSETSRDQIAGLGHSFVRDGTVVLTHGYSRCALLLLLKAAATKHFSVIVSEGSPEGAGYACASKLAEAGVPVTVILDSAVGHFMERAHLCVTGAEGVLENGGIVNKVGTFQLAVMAKAFNKPFYVAAESYKFARLFPLDQRDFPEGRVPPVEMKVPEGTFKGITASSPCVDYTPAEYITLLFTDLGVLTPSAVSDELIRLYGEA